MLHLMRIEWIKVRFPVLATIMLLTITACICTCTLYQNYLLWYDLDAWEIGTELFTFLFPLFVVLPLCWNLYYERKDHFLLYVLPRVAQRKYLLAKWLVHALCAFAILLIPYVFSAICALYVKAPVPPYEPDLYATPFRHVFLNAYTQMPLLYALLLSFWKGLIGVLVMTLGFVLSMYSKNIFVILTGPFLYVVLENFILAVLRLEKYRLVVSFEPTAVSNVTIFSFLVGPVLIMLLTAFLVFFLHKIKKMTIVSM